MKRTKRKISHVEQTSLPFISVAKKTKASSETVNTEHQQTEENKSSTHSESVQRMRSISDFGFGMEVSRVQLGSSDASSDESEAAILDHDTFLDVMDELVADPVGDKGESDEELAPLDGESEKITLLKMKTFCDQHNLELQLRFGMAESIGPRKTMEDRTTVFGDFRPQRENAEYDSGRHAAFFAVYDGHGGSGTADKLKQRLHKNIFGSASYATDLETAFMDACEKTDRDLLQEDYNLMCKQQSDFEKGLGKGLTTQTFSGSTAVFAVISKKYGSRESAIFVGNVGDCRAVLCSGPDGVARDLTQDHKPSNKDEQERVEQAGGYIHNGRLNGVLAVSRSFGDINHKVFPPQLSLWTCQQLISRPDITTLKILPAHEFMILACDGLWDVLSSQQAVNYVRRRLFVHGDVQRASQDLIKKALEYGSVDNVSAVIVCLNQILKGPGNTLQKLFGATPPMSPPKSPRMSDETTSSTPESSVIIDNL